MKSRPHKQIGILYLRDSESKREYQMENGNWYESIYCAWFNENHKYRLTTSEGRVYISESSGLFYEILTDTEDDAHCPIWHKSIHKNGFCKTRCKKRIHNHHTDTKEQVVMCTACDNK